MVQKYDRTHTHTRAQAHRYIGRHTNEKKQQKPKAHRISCVLDPLRDEMQNKLEIFYAVCWCRAVSVVASASAIVLAVIFCFPFIQIVYLSIFTFSCFLFVFCVFFSFFFFCCCYIHCAQHHTTSSSFSALLFGSKNLSSLLRWFSSFTYLLGSSLCISDETDEEIGVEIVPAFEWNSGQQSLRLTAIHTILHERDEKEEEEEKKRVTHTWHMRNQWKK